MKSNLGVVPKLSYLLLAAFLVATAFRSHNDTTTALVISSVLMFGFCWANATHLLGAKPALKFVLISVAFGWFAEQMGSSRGWFFGSYTYTDVLGWRVGDVPAVIPLMWFALCYVGYIIANFAIWQYPVDGAPGLRRMLFMSFLAAMIVTAYDLGADPYMVFVLKAWIMAKTDGWWFGETLQGFVGWAFVATVIVFCFRLSTRKQSLHALPGFAKWHALLPFSIYAFSMVFTMFMGHPVETRTIAVFAMGVPLLMALAGWWRWKPAAHNVPPQQVISESRLAHMQYQADPLADETMARILGPWQNPVDAASQAAHWAKIALVNTQFAQWTTNQSLVNWQGTAGLLPGPIQAELQAYLAAGQALPDWADPVKIERAEALFDDYGPLSCTLLFCSSLPECYVVPDLSAVLHVAGQLEQNTEYRIRSTAAMIFPVMMKGGLCTPGGSGVAQIVKVRLIHATIRNLILRGSPQDALTAVGDHRHRAGANVVAALPRLATDTMYESMFKHGWRLGDDGLPCGQEELAYTLLTFGYVFLRSMRVLGQGLSQADEEAYLHAWNVVGHLLGIRRELMVDTMEEAEGLFMQMQARGRKNQFLPDPRPGLGEALMRTMENAMPLPILFKPFPVLLTRYLCGAANAVDIGVDERASWLSRLVFIVVMTLVKLIDNTVRLLVPEFSIFRFITRILGYHLMCKILLDQSRPLKLPVHLLNDVNNMMATWGNDRKAPQWMNKLEDKLTQPGNWNVSPQGEINGPKKC